MFKNNKPEYDKPETIIGESVKIEMQKFTSKGSVHINGSIAGDVDVENSLVIGKQASVKGSIHTKYLLVAGEINGNVVASEQIQITSGGKIIGDITSKSIVIEEGAQIDGHCKMILEDEKHLKSSKTK